MLLSTPMTGPTVVPSHAPLSRELWSRHIYNEFENLWPTPRCITSFPAEWSLLARGTTVSHPTTAVSLMAHRRGGVHVVYRNINCGDTCVVAYGGTCIRLGFVYTSLVDMHRELVGLESRNPGGLEHTSPLEAATTALVSLYDPHDPEEEAERLLVAMGGPVSRYPACLT
jgi:hypothetical protein